MDISESTLEEIKNELGDLKKSYEKIYHLMLIFFLIIVGISFTILSHLPPPPSSAS